uniref:Ciliary rootlet coiled-coil, rootletin family member 2 n=1 Tax=Pundamilia nyererei TaxID=303518 RepID=A0A3B4GVC1_9CICH
KLEESLLQSDGSSGERSLTLQEEGQESRATPVPVSSRIRQIITHNLAEDPAESSEFSALEERRDLRGRLSPSQMDQDQLVVKQSGLTERQLDQILMLQPAVDSDQHSVSTEAMQPQNKERAYRQKLLAYQEAQQRQVQLVQKLQTKVIQYKKRCGELEEQVLEKTSETEKMRLLGHLDKVEYLQRVEQDLNVAIQNKSAQLEEEQKSASLSQVNSMLREQLDQVGTVNKGLTESLWKAREDAESCDTRLRREQETCASRLSWEQAHVRALWRQAASLRSSFTQLRTFTDTLSDMRTECVAASRQLHAACMNLEARVTQGSPCGGVEMSALERQLKDKLKEAMQLQAQCDAEKVKLNSILELTDTMKHLQSQNSEKDISLNTMQISLDRMETRRTEDKAEMEILHTEIQALQKILHHVHQLQELRARLGAALEQVDTLREHQQERDAERRELEQKIQDVRRESQEDKKALEESLRDSNRYRRSLELISEKSSLEKLLSGLQQEVDSQRAEMEVLRSSSLELQRQRDLLRQQREDLEMQLARQNTEAQRLQELEGKHSDLRRELVMVKEALSQITLQKEVLEDDKASLTLALSKLQIESQSAAQELAFNKLQNQEAALKDSLDKMAALSEGLAKDKVELSRILLQTEGEKRELCERRREAEAERAAAREDAARAQKEMMDLLAEKQALESSHSHLQDLCLKLEAELSLLQKEKAQALEKRSQRAEKESLETALFESQELASSLEAERSRLEGERRGLLSANEALTEAAQMRADAERQCAQAKEERSKLEEKLAQVERSTLLTLTSKQQIHREQLEAERQQKEQQRAELMLQREQAEEQLRRQCEELRAHSQKELQQVREELARLKQEFGQSLLQAENEKQQMEAEKAVLTEKLASLREDLATAEMDMDRLQRESLRKQEQDKNQMAVLQSELRELQLHFEESLNSHESDKKSLTEQVRELNQQREHAQQEEGEDGRFKGQRELIEAHREIQGCAQERDKLRKDVVDLRRLLGNETREKEAIQASNQELRALVKRAESDNSLRRAVEENEQKVAVLEEQRSSMQQEATALRSGMRELEKSRLQVRRELQELRRQVKVLEGENIRQKQELRELQARVCEEEQKEEEARREAFTLKQRVLECEAGREAVLNEVAGLQRRVMELESTEHQNRELLQEKETFQWQSDQRHRETTAQLEAALEDARAQIKELSMQVGVAKNKAQSVEEQLEVSDAKCRDLELKLAGLYAALRRTVGINHVRLSDKPGSRRRFPSPWRGESVANGSLLSVSYGEDKELDLESVNTALREFQQELTDAQRDRKESLEATEGRVRSLELSQRALEGELQRAQLRVAELDAEAGALQERLTDMRRKLGESEDRCASEERLATSLAQAEQHESQLREQIHKLSNTLNDSRSNTGALQEQITQLQRALTASEQDRRLLQERLDKTRDALSESKRLNHMLAEQNQNLQRVQENSNFNISELEKHNRTLKESLKQQQEAELQTSQQLHREKKELQEKVANLQSFLQKRESERAEIEKVVTRFGKDKSALRKALEKVEMERLRKEEEAASVARAREELEQRVWSLEQQLAGKQNEMQTLQAHISQSEHAHAHRLLEVTARHHQELDMETERLRDNQLQAEQALESREKAHRQRVRGLEEQLLALKEQLDQETRRRQAY